MEFCSLKNTASYVFRICSHYHAKNTLMVQRSVLFRKLQDFIENTKLLKCLKNFVELSIPAKWMILKTPSIKQIQAITNECHINVYSVISIRHIP